MNLGLPIDSAFVKPFDNGIINQWSTPSRERSQERRFFVALHGVVADTPGEIDVSLTKPRFNAAVAFLSGR